MDINIEGPGKLLRVFIGEEDHYKGKPLYHVILHNLKKEGVAGATVLRAIEGYGAKSRVIHSSSILRLSEDLPIVIEVADNEKGIEKARSIIGDLVAECKCGVLMTLEDIEIIHYSP